MIGSDIRQKPESRRDRRSLQTVSNRVFDRPEKTGWSSSGIRKIAMAGKNNTPCNANDMRTKPCKAEVARHLLLTEQSRCDRGEDDSKDQFC